MCFPLAGVPDPGANPGLTGSYPRVDKPRALSASVHLVHRSDSFTNSSLLESCLTAHPDLWVQSSRRRVRRYARCRTCNGLRICACERFRASGFVPGEGSSTALASFARMDFKSPLKCLFDIRHMFMARRSKSWSTFALPL
jgi:hypothetical protein